MKTYKKNFRKTVWGYFEVKANSPSAADKKFDDGDCEEFDNKSDYDMDEKWTEE